MTKHSFHSAFLPQEGSEPPPGSVDLFGSKFHQDKSSHVRSGPQKTILLLTLSHLVACVEAIDGAYEGCFMVAGDG